jgi:uncharacterized membrane protein YphA (DoxX/SURF4 family)
MDSVGILGLFGSAASVGQNGQSCSTERTSLAKSGHCTAASGRLLIAALFIRSGIGKIAAPATIEGYIASAGLPAPLLDYFIVEVGGGVLLIVGFQTRSSR